MKKQQILLSLLGVAMIVGLYQLPRVVVENESDASVESHDFTISTDDAKAMSALKEALKGANIEKSSNFADSLARYFLKYGLLDSAEAVVNAMLLRDSSLYAKKIGIQILYQTFERAASTEDASGKAGKLRPLIEEVLEQNPEDLSLKNKWAMTLVTTETPMSGIQVLREIIGTNPNNREALINLGLLSIQSGQFDRAVGRFEKLIELDSTDFEAMLYLGVAYMETGQSSEARRVFTSVASSTDTDPAVKQAAENYLSTLVEQ